MNRIFKTVWNAVRRCLVVVNETTKSTAQSRRRGSVITKTIPLVFGSIIPSLVQAADWYPYWSGYDWMTVYSSVVNYNNFYFNAKGSVYPWFIMTSPLHNNVTNVTMNISNNLEITYKGAIFQISQPNDKYYSKGTVNVGGDVLINGGSLNGSTSVAGQYTAADSVLNVQGTTTITNGYMSGGYSSNQGTTYNVKFTLKDVIIGENGSFGSGSAKNGRFNFNATLDSVLIKDGGSFSAHSGGNGLYSTISVADSMTFEKGSELINYRGLVLGASKQNYLAIANTLNFYGTTVTENMVLEQEQGAINITEGEYVFADFSQTGGVLTNGADVTFNDANISAEGQLINTGSISFNGTSVLNKLIEGDGTVNIIGGTFNTDHFESGIVNLQDGVTTLASLNDKAQYNMTGGELHIDTGEIFGSLGVMGDGELNVISLNATMPETIRTELTEFFKKYVPGFVKENLDQYASFTGGKIVLKVDSLTENQEADLKTAFKETFTVTKYQKTFPSIPLFSAYLQYSRLV